MKNKIAIIGCDGSATGYTSKVLKAFGVDTGHEVEGENGTIDWTSTMKELDDYDCVFHQVRTPLVVVSICQDMKSTSWDLIKKTGIIEQGDSILLRSMKYWLYWNKASQKRAIFTYQVEAIEEALPRLFAHMEWGYNPYNFNKIKGLDMVSNSSTYPKLTWSDLRGEDEELAMGMVLLAKGYGYFAQKTVKEIENWNI